MSNQENLENEYAVEVENVPVIPITGDPYAGERLGHILKEARENKNIQLSTIADTLCIRESFLKALEEGNYTVFPALVYAAGFLRSYASYLGVDVRPLMEKFHNETAHLKEDMAEVPTVTTKNVVPTKRFLFSLIILILSVWGFCTYCTNQEKPDLKESETVKTEPALSNEMVVAPPVLGDVLVASVQPEAVESRDIKELSKELKSLIPGQKHIDKSVFTGEAYGAKEGYRVSVLATDKVWVEVKNNEQVVFTKVLSKGDYYNAPIDGGEYVLRTGNAGALSVYLDGEFKKVLGKQGHVLKNILLIASEYEK